MEKAGKNNNKKKKKKKKKAVVDHASATRANLGKGGRKKRAMLYISLETRGLGFWCKIDFERIPNAAAATNIRAVPIREMDFPFETCNYLGSTRCVCVNSKIYVIGGYQDDDSLGKSLYTNKMSVFDASTKTWNHHHDGMHVSRVLHTVVAVADNIFVFGGESNVLEDGMYVVPLKIPKEQWAEFYDTKSRIWKYLPNPPPQQLADSTIRLHAVYHSNNQILFWTDKAGVYSYNYHTQTWRGPSEYSSLSEINTLSGFSYSVAIVDHALFWHYRGKIYAYHLITNQFLLSHTLDKSHTDFWASPQVPDSDFLPDPNFLLSVGENALLFLFWDFNNKPARKFQCYKFQIQKSSDVDSYANGGPKLSLVPDGCGLFDISAVHAMSANTSGGHKFSPLPDGCADFDIDAVKVISTTPLDVLLVVA